MLRIEVEEDFVATQRAASLEKEKPRRSISLALPSLAVASSFSRRSFSYSKLPEEPIKLSIRKLDGSSFDVEVIKSATIAELKLAVQDVFSDMPRKGHGKISWPHVWGHFCLCYEDQKLLTDTDHIIYYGIKDGDQLHFIRHVSSIYNLTKIRSKRRMVAQKQSFMSISSSASSLESLQNDEEDDDYDYMENGRCQSLENKNQSIIVQQECQFGHLWGGWSSDSRKSSIKKTGSSKDRDCHSNYCTFLGNFRKILQLWGSAKHSPKRLLRKD